MKTFKNIVLAVLLFVLARAYPQDKQVWIDPDRDIVTDYHEYKDYYFPIRVADASSRTEKEIFTTINRLYNAVGIELASREHSLIFATVEECYQKKRFGFKKQGALEYLEYGRGSQAQNEEIKRLIISRRLVAKLTRLKTLEGRQAGCWAEYDSLATRTLDTLGSTISASRRLTDEELHMLENLQTYDYVYYNGKKLSAQESMLLDQYKTAVRHLKKKCDARYERYRRFYRANYQRYIDRFGWAFCYAMWKSGVRFYDEGYTMDVVLETE